MTRLPLENIRIDGGTQPRCAINGDVVADYAEAMQEGATFPPLTVFHDGVDYWLADGFHRYHAHARAQFREADCEVKTGTQRDAVLFSVGANTEHGLRRTNDDKRRAIEVLVRDTEWGRNSDNWVAQVVKVSPHTVARARSDFAIAKSPERTGADGRTTNTENIGRKPAKPKGTAPTSAPAQQAAPLGIPDEPPDFSAQEAWEAEWVNRETEPLARLEKARILVLKAALLYAEAKEGSHADFPGAQETLDYVACRLLEAEREDEADRIAVEEVRAHRREQAENVPHAQAPASRSDPTDPVNCKLDPTDQGAKSRAVVETPHQQLLAKYEDALGYKLPNGAQEASGAKKLLGGGFTAEDAIACYHHLKAQEFWADKHLSLQVVFKNIGAWKTARPVTNGRWNGRGLRPGQTVDERQREMMGMLRDER